jgi:SAM-dependent methyltransferase
MADKPSRSIVRDMRRKVIAELLDEDLGTAAEIAASLTDLRHINRWFGGTRTTAALLRRVARASGCRQLSVLEVGGGAGDVPLAAQSVLAREGIELHLTITDRICSHLPVRGASAVAGDALHLPFRNGVFDVVSCSLLAHHFEPDELQLFVREALRVCRHAVLINDLIRSRIHLALVFLGLPLFRSRLTWHDAPASVRRAYTTDEMRALLSHLPAKRIQMSKRYLYRMGVLVWK